MQSRFIDDLPALIDAKNAVETARGYFNTLWHIARSKFNLALIDRILGSLTGVEHQQRVYALKKAISRRKRHGLVQAIKIFKQSFLNRRNRNDKNDDNPEPSP